MTERDLRYNTLIAVWCYNAREYFHTWQSVGLDKDPESKYQYMCAALYLRRLREERNYPKYIPEGYDPNANEEGC